MVKLELQFISQSLQCEVSKHPQCKDGNYYIAMFCHFGLNHKYELTNFFEKNFLQGLSFAPVVCLYSV